MMKSASNPQFFPREDEGINPVGSPNLKTPSLLALELGGVLASASSVPIPPQKNRGEDNDDCNALFFSPKDEEQYERRQEARKHLMRENFEEKDDSSINEEDLEEKVATYLKEKLNADSDENDEEEDDDLIFQFTP